MPVVIHVLELLNTSHQILTKIINKSMLFGSLVMMSVVSVYG